MLTSGSVHRALQRELNGPKTSHRGDMDTHTRAPRINRTLSSAVRPFRGGVSFPFHSSRGAETELTRCKEDAKKNTSFFNVCILICIEKKSSSLKELSILQNNATARWWEATPSLALALALAHSRRRCIIHAPCGATRVLIFLIFLKRVFLYIFLKRATLFIDEFPRDEIR